MGRAAKAATGVKAVKPAKAKATKQKLAGKLPAKAESASGPVMPPLVVQPHGGALLAGGVPGHAGAGGRPANWLRDFCDDLLASEATKDQVKAILEDAKHPAFKDMWKAVADRAHGKPAQAIELTGKDGGPVETKQTILIGGVHVVF